MKRMGGRVISRKDLAKHWNVSPFTVDDMSKRGLLKRVGRGLFDYDHAQAVRLSQHQGHREREMLKKLERGERPPTDGTLPADAAVDLSGAAGTMLRARTDKALAQARQAQAELKMLASDLVSIETARADAVAALAAIRSVLDPLPARLGPELAKLRTTRECVAFLEAEIRRAITELRAAVAKA